MKTSGISSGLFITLLLNHSSKLKPVSSAAAGLAASPKATSAAASVSMRFIAPPSENFGGAS